MWTWVEMEDIGWWGSKEGLQDTRSEGELEHVL